MSTTPLSSAQFAHSHDEPLFSSEGLIAGYIDGEPVLNDVDLVIQPGTLLSIMGVSGSGKTTLLRVIGGIVRPVAGEARLFGQSLASTPDGEVHELRRRRIGFVFQTPTLLGELSAVDNVALPLRLLGVRRKVARHSATMLLETLGLADCVDARPHQLSGGQNQRIAIARAVVHKPDLILADEPTASLDRTNGDLAMATLVHAVNSVGGALILATHDQRAASFCHEHTVLTDSRLVLRAADVPTRA